VFTFPDTGQNVRTVIIDEPWFVATDVCAVLKHTNATVALAALDEDEKRILRRSEALSFAYPIDDLRVQSIAVINEPGLYSLILRSNLPAARAFKRWVTHEVLPAIRKTGSYAVPAVPQTLPEALRAYANEVEAREAAEQQLALAAPKADAWDVLASADGDFSVREAAFILNRDPAIDTGQVRLFNLLRTLKVIDGRNIPYAAHSSHVRLRTRTYTDRTTGDERQAEPQVRITTAGLAYMHKKLGGTTPVSTHVNAAIESGEVNQ
jgi:prophage antirepressor-like protein